MNAQPTWRRTRQWLGVLSAVVLLLLAIGGAWRAVTPRHAATPQERAVAVERDLRCPTCQGLSVADSPSPIAAGMRRQVEQQLAAGATPAQVRGYFTARYGDWILLDPPRRGIGWLVWLAPPLLFAAGLSLLRRTLRRRRSVSGPPASPADLAIAAKFADDRPPDEELPEPVAAALTDLQAARVDADLDPACPDAVDEALSRLAAALHDHPAAPIPVRASGQAPDGDPDLSAVSAAEPQLRESKTQRRAVRHALVTSAVLFAGVLTVTLSRVVADRPAGTVPTGAFATTSPTAGIAPGPSTGQLATLQRATQAQPNDPRAWLAYATALDEAGRLADAEPAYRRVLDLDSANVVAREKLAWLLTRGGSPVDALTVLSPLTRERPGDPQVVLLVGLAQRGAGRPQADTTLRRYLALAPDTAAAVMVRALLGQTP